MYLKFTKSNATTMIDVLLTLSISLTCVFLITSALQYGKIMTLKLDETREQEWGIFLAQLEQQMMYSKRVRIEQGSLRFDSLEDPYSFTTPIKDQVWKPITLKIGNEGWLNYSINGGTNIILTSVGSCVYEIFPRYVKLYITFKDGQKKMGVVARGFD
ncbi:hypothetical protein IGK74_000028 [Enterococcus sp. AZ150]|uniref:Uncharacterized protein n=1 Tax=Enterococcus sulfureus ATCC 49903 TaxID=1140003 RepID=S0KM95_9ENTE|nr:ComGF family competence protein [Enterococcus sulfureus]EOT45842.1 hypothetical protein OMY_01863 [Enterococcus sulfureus ATCC 49903]EOT83107.1 hypothetical protein I573_02220 [Enterococcus sulfureus ATCC 49903]